MLRLSPLSGRQLIKALAKVGYRKVRQRGSHIRLVCTGKKSITVPNHPQIGKGLLHKILRDAEISPSELSKFLK